ncbi:MAG TPA: molybdopterin-binding protein [Porticoccaceae bacterium]|jgi:DMSO/TMAO reductase YedYZ molybdopterin-dependent catalytic subunit|nr:molybdopterin-binding protein [Gammaproteobacteria bacterium]HIL61301.1 molybdopterin-binding protein [Porticoccaceae bacterium]
MKNTKPKTLSRRQLISRAGALGGILLTGCDSNIYTPPTIRDGLMGVADVLTMASQRFLLSNQALVQEHDINEITKNFPVWNQSNPEDEEYQRLRRGSFAEWRLSVEGLVNQPISLSLEDLKRFPKRTQITSHICEQGWSAIAQWTGAPLLKILEAAGGVKPEARYVVIDAYGGWYEGYDMFDVVHPQTILAYGMNGKDLPQGNGAPVRLRVERHCGYKQLKFIKSIQVVSSMDGFGRGTGGLNSDFDFHWYAGA